MTESLLPFFQKQPHVVLATGTVSQGIGGIDSVTGILTVRKAGPVLVEASTGNDASGRLLLSVNNTPAREVLRERWDDLRMTAWYPFGYPAASIDSTRGQGRVLSNNGDGSFTSGVVSRQAFDVRDGLPDYALPAPAEDRRCPHSRSPAG